MTPGNVGLRRAVLPAVGAVLTAVVIAVQVGSGGGDFVPLAAADACSVRSATSVSRGIDGLTERLVLLGLDRAACRLGVSREAFLLQLAQERTATDQQVAALRAGLDDAVDLMKAGGTLPPASALTDEALDRSDLNGLLKAAIRALPDSVINRAVKTDDVLHRMIAKLDLHAVLANVSNPDALTQQINRAVTDAVKESLQARLHDLL